MVIVDVSGGLGNQMFQYAAGRALSEKLQQPLRLDVTSFNDYSLHNGFELESVFLEDIQISSKQEIREILGWQAVPLVRRLVKGDKLQVLRNKKHIVEPHFQYWEGLRKVSGDLYISGYWQSEKYFHSIIPIIRENFLFKRPMSENNQKIASEIKSGNSVSLHIRRGDYISNETNLATHGACSLKYYDDAIRYISMRNKKLELYIFSDDIQWVKENLKIDFPHQYINHNQGVESYNDMRLMSLCKHHIIANSSFSWWGAWLCSNANKTVVAPKRWFVKTDIDTRDITPDSWVRL